MVVPLEDLADARGRPAAVEQWLLDDLGLVDTGVRLAEADHVAAVRSGENAWLVALERYLIAHEADAERLLAEEGAP